MSITCGRCSAISTDETAAFCGSCGAPLKKKNAGMGEPAMAPARPSGSPEARPHRTIPEAPSSAALKPIGLPPTEPPSPPQQAPPVHDGGYAPKPPVHDGGYAPKPPAAPPAGAPRDKPFTAPKHLPPGTLIDKKYAVLRVLGEGGMGVVYLARDIHTGLDVVVKAVRSELAHRDDVRARTLAEGRALAQIDHPNVVHLRAVAVEGPHLFLVMQYIDGESLDKIIARHVERGEPMPVEEALAVFRQVASGVGAAHQEGVIHRDLKPANVLLRTKDKVAKVTDFGIALVPSDTSRPHTRGILGSLWYMSPEQVTGRRDLDHRVDVYALGIMLYQMLVGRVPFDAKSDYEIMKLHAEAPMPLAVAARPDVPSAVDDLMQKACAKEREQRFQRCEDLVAAVDRLLGYDGMRTGPTFPGQNPAGSTPAIPLVTLGATPMPSLSPLAGATSQPGHDGGPPPKPLGPTLTVTTSRPGEAVDDGGSVPDPGSEPLPPPRPRRVGRWIALAVVLLAAGGGGALLALGLIPGVPGLFKPSPRPRADAGAPVASARGSADAGKPGLDALAGAWIGNGRELTAVLAGSDLEFRVKKPDQFPRQGYDVGDARFVLRATPEADVFSVEDRIRPVLPTGKLYDARARGTCQEVWTTVAGEPLRARHDGTRLSVEFAKIEPTLTNFTMEGGKVTSCVGLRDLKASKVVIVLTRP